MRLLVVQLSDIHFQASGNPIEDRVEALARAVLSVQPRPEGCLILVTGDIANGGETAQYLRAAAFFAKLQSLLEEVFGPGNISFDFIPGNHDCLLPEEEVEVRGTLVEGARPHLSQPRMNEGYLRALLAPQAAFLTFYYEMTGITLAGSAAVLRLRDFTVGGTRIRLLAINTALLTQRHEEPGHLYIPPSLFGRDNQSTDEATVNIAIYHHPPNWLDPNLRREFIRQVEGFAHIALTGHEHQSDEHWSESASGEQTTFIEADALQERSYPKKSGFTVLVLDVQNSQQRYYHFRWRQDQYLPSVKDRVHPASFAQKTAHRFRHTPRFSSYLTFDDFGFTHPRKRSLELPDFFVYPPLLVSDPAGEGNSSIVGEGVTAALLGAQSAYVQGNERSGKTALLKMFCVDTLENTNRVPVLLKSEDIPTSVDETLFAFIDTLIRNQYGNDSVERFRQLDRSKRIIVLDDLQRLGKKQKASFAVLLSVLKQHFGLVLVTSSQLPQYSDFEAELKEGEPLFERSLTIRELPPSSRAAIVNKWLQLESPDSVSSESLLKEATREQAFLSDLIRRRALPSLPYLIVGVLQIRHNKKEDLVDPGSFGYLFQRLVIDALSVSTTPATAFVDRKDGVLRRFAYSLHALQAEGGERSLFDTAVQAYSSEITIRVDSEAIYADLINAKVLKEVDGFITFRHSYFFHYFVARQLLDIVDSDNPEPGRTALETMAEKPLITSNQITLMFYLFFKKRDPIIDSLIKHASRIFEQEPLTDIVSDVRLIDEKSTPPPPPMLENPIDLRAAASKRLKAEDKVEQRQLAQPYENESQYDDQLELALKYRFALARIDLLGQVIRSFSGSLDGTKKQEILEAVFRLGLRSLHALLVSLQTLSAAITTRIAEVDAADQRSTLESLSKRILAFLGRVYCDSALLNISRAVGVSDIEASYEAAIGQLPPSCATQLLELAIKLDHSPVFPFALLKTTRLAVSRESNLASQVLTDLVVRHVHIVPLGRESIKRIAQTLRLDTQALISSTKE